MLIFYSSRNLFYEFLFVLNVALIYYLSWLLSSCFFVLFCLFVCFGVSLNFMPLTIFSVLIIPFILYKNKPIKKVSPRWCWNNVNNTINNAVLDYNSKHKVNTHEPILMWINNWINEYGKMDKYPIQKNSTITLPSRKGSINPHS